MLVLKSTIIITIVVLQWVIKEMSFPKKTTSSPHDGFHETIMMLQSHYVHSAPEALRPLCVN